MKKLITFLSLIIITVSIFGQNLPRKAVYSSIGVESLIDRFPDYRTDGESPLVHPGWVIGDYVYLLSYESGDAYKRLNKKRNTFLYRQKYKDTTDYWVKATKKPVIKFYGNEDEYYEYSYFTIYKKGAGLSSRIEYLNEWDVHLILLRVNYGCGHSKLDKYWFIVPVFFVPQGNGEYKSFAFEPINFKPDYYYGVKGMGVGIVYDDNRNEYSIGFSKNTYDAPEEYRLYFTKNENKILISNSSKYESSTIH